MAFSPTQKVVVTMPVFHWKRSPANFGGSPIAAWGSSHAASGLETIDWRSFFASGPPSAFMGPCGTSEAIDVATKAEERRKRLRNISRNSWRQTVGSIPLLNRESKFDRVWRVAARGYGEKKGRRPLSFDLKFQLCTGFGFPQRIGRTERMR